MISTKVDGRARRGAMTRAITFQKVLLAIYVLSEEDGLVCSESNARIGRECGHGADAVSRSIAEMRDRGIVMDYDTRDGMSCRKIVLMDHPEAEALGRHIEGAYRVRQWR